MNDWTHYLKTRDWQELGIVFTGAGITVTSIILFMEAYYFLAKRFFKENK